MMKEDLITPSPLGGWNFDFGKSFASQVLDLFGCPVHFSPYFSSSPFILVVDFVRFNFRLTVKSVAIALQACLGGSPHGFSVLSLKANCFSFQVCNKNVGLYVNSFRDFTCKDFHVRFFLWGNGGPNWRREFDLWEKEENDLWSVVSYKKKVQHSVNLRANKAVKFQINHSLGKRQIDKPSVFKRLFLGDPFPVHQCSSSGTVVPPLVIQPGSDSKYIAPSPKIAHSVTSVIIPEVIDHSSPRISPSASLNSGQSRESLFCNRYLAHGHGPANCRSLIHCRSCFNYGHFARACLAQKPSRVWRVKPFWKAEPSGNSVFVSSALFLLESASSSLPVSPPPPPPPQFPSSAQCLSSPRCKTPLALVLPSSRAHLHDADFRPELFLLEGTNIEVPWEGRTPRADLTLQGVLPNSHQEFAAVVVDPQPPEHLFGQLIQEVANIIEHQHHIHVVRIQRYPLALCLVQLPSVLDRDILVASGPVLLGNWFHGTFVRHDQLANWRNSPYTREGWLMILGIPLNLKTGAIIERITNLCGEFIDWHYRDRVLGRVLVKARYKSANEVPNCIVLGDTMAYGGNGQTWTFHVYVLNGEPTDMLPGDEDLLPIWQMMPPPQQHHHHNKHQHHNEEDFNANHNQNEDIGGQPDDFGAEPD